MYNKHTQNTLAVKCNQSHVKIAQLLIIMPNWQYISVNINTPNNKTTSQIIPANS